MPYWMENPEHGVMPVYDMGDVERNMAHGWVLLNVGESPALKAEKPAVETIETPVRKKPGPKPKAK
jgi:hypothetical protein